MRKRLSLMFLFVCLFVCLFVFMCSGYRDKGMPDNSATRGTISSIFSGMINLG